MEKAADGIVSSGKRDDFLVCEDTSEGKHMGLQEIENGRKKRTRE